MLAIVKNVSSSTSFLFKSNKSETEDSDSSRQKSTGRCRVE